MADGVADEVDNEMKVEFAPFVELSVTATSLLVVPSAKRRHPPHT
jgi:hypothetical protein